MDTVRRLFWTFPDGLPGSGLLLMRLTTAGALLYRAATMWQGQVTLSALESLGAVFLLAGLGTPIAGVFVGVIEAWQVHRHPQELWVHGLLAVLGISVALIGPGAVSLDARMFGWRQIDVGGSRPSRLERGRRERE